MPRVRDLRLGDAGHRPSRHQGGVGIHQGNVERVGDDVQEDLPALFEGVLRQDPPQETLQATVGDGHPFGLSGAARSKHDVIMIICSQPPWGGRFLSAGELGDLLRGQDERGAAGRRDALDPLRGHGRVHRHIRTPRFDDAQVGDDQLRLLVSQNDHRRLLRERPGQVGGQGVGPAAQFPVGEGTTPTDVGRVIRGRPAPVIDALDDFHERSPRNSGK